MANIENLKRAFNHVLLNVSESQFDMSYFRRYKWGSSDGLIIRDLISHECNTVGCIIGHCSILDTEENFYTYESFAEWADSFFDIQGNDILYNFLFSGIWGDNELMTGSKRQALLRLMFAIEDIETSGSGYPDGFLYPEVDSYHDYDYEMIMDEANLVPYKV